MKKVLITAFALLSVSVSAFAGSKALSTGENNDAPQISHFDMKVGWTCGIAPITFECPLSKALAKDSKSSKI